MWKFISIFLILSSLMLVDLGVRWKNGNGINNYDRIFRDIYLFYPRKAQMRPHITQKMNFHGHPKPTLRPIVPNFDVTVLYLINSTSSIFERNHLRATILNILGQYVPEVSYQFRVKHVDLWEPRIYNDIYMGRKDHGCKYAGKKDLTKEIF